jgi:VanZ family protein
MAPVSTPRQWLARAISASAEATRMWRALLLLLVVAVSYLALTPQPPASITLGWDKLNHMAAFTALAFLAYLSFPASRLTLLILPLGLLAFGGLIEVLQLFVPSRSCEWGDLFADSIGIACGAFIASSALWAASRLLKRSR